MEVGLFPNFLGPSLAISGDDFQVGFTPSVALGHAGIPPDKTMEGKVETSHRGFHWHHKQGFEESFDLGCL